MADGFIVRKGGGGIDAEIETFFQPLIANESNMPLVFDQDGPKGISRQVVETDDDFVYVSFSGGVNGIYKYHKNNFAFVGNTIQFSAFSRMSIDNDFIYAAEFRDKLRKFHKGNLVLDRTSANITENFSSVAYDNDFFYVGLGFSNFRVRKYTKSLLTATSDISDNFGGIEPQGMFYDNDFLYVGGGTTKSIVKLHAGNLAFVGNSNSYVTTISSVTVDNDFVYAGGFGGANFTESDVKQWHKENLVFVQKSIRIAVNITTISVDDEFVYVGTVAGTQPAIRKLFKENLVVMGNTAVNQNYRFLKIDGEFIYPAQGGANHFIHLKREIIQEEINDPQGKIVFNDTTYIKEDLI
jgi:hypothetical protein